MAQEMVGIRLPLMCAEVYGELREPNPQKGIVSSKPGFLGRGVGKGDAARPQSLLEEEMKGERNPASPLRDTASG